jgi:hypothetical protein
MNHQVSLINSISKQPPLKQRVGLDPAGIMENVPEHYRLGLTGCHNREFKPAVQVQPVLVSVLVHPY